MTRYIVEFRTNPGEGDKAMGLFRQMKEYFKNQHQKTLEVFYQAFGAPGTFQAVMDFESLAQLETLANAIRKDPAYQRLSDEARRVFTADSFSTSVYYQV
ncbi:NIPSNAP family protein [Sulfobacillus harzensis]|uniref:NIPSNAP domain-containing protein n=1 Tax=Sulfobacillus harzensis TaxID=2729629 RepID=A0A7Y0L9W2_9FIRM|nr:NIPSNAP family protein [Sulfobacillus harzensis]NMP24564.1 hypothetical protein [Sulfobacillus harzensis]